MKTRGPLAALAAMSCLALTACTGGAPAGQSDTGVRSGDALSGEISFQTWSLKNEKFTPYFESLIADFEEQNPGVTVKWIDQPGDGYEDKVLQQAEAGELPDVVNLNDVFAYQLAQVDKIVDLKTATPEVMDTYVKGGLEAYTFDGLEGTYGYPWYLGTDVAWWNMEQLKQAGIDSPPTTIDEYFQVAKEAAEKTGGQVKLLSELPKIEALADQGVELFKDGEFVFNTPNAVQVLQQYIDLYAAGAMPSDALNDDYTGNAELFTQSKVGYTTATASFVTQMTNDSPNLLDKVAVTSRLAGAPLFPQGVSVAKDSKNMATALAFAQFVTNDENQIEFVKLAQGFMPGTVAANEDPNQFVGEDDSQLLKDAITLAAEGMADAHPPVPVQYTDDMKKYTSQQFGLAFQGEITAQEALDKAVDYANQSLIR